MNPQSCYQNKVLPDSYTPDEILAIIAAFGWEKQNKALLEAGFTDLKANFKLLKCYDGSVSQIFQKLGYKQKKTSQSPGLKENHEESKDENIDSLNNNTNKNNNNPCPFKDLSTINEKKIKVVIKKKGEHCKTKELDKESEKALVEIVELGYSEQNEKLIQSGFICNKKNLKVLKEFKGNLELALPRLAEMQKKWEEEIRRQKLEKQFKDKAKMRMLSELQSLGYLEAHKKLCEAGWTKITKNYQYLKATKGDFSKVKKIYETHIKLQEIEEKTGVKLQKYWTFPEHINTVYLDANNIFFASDHLKKLIQEQKCKEAFKILITAAKKFSSIANGGKGFHCIVVFDKICSPIEEIVYSEKGQMLSFMVVSAQPKFANANEAFVDWITTKNLDLKKTIFVTSSKELMINLIDKGAREIMSAINYLSLMRNTVGEEFINSLISG